MVTSFETFLREGKFGPLELGLPRGDVLAYLGRPKDWLAGEREVESGIWKYNNLELTFENHVLILISLYFRNGDFGFVSAINSNSTTDSSHLENFMRYLEENGIEYQIGPQLTFETQTCLKIGARGMVSAVFDSEENLVSLYSKK